MRWQQERDPKVKRDLPEKNDNPIYDAKSAGYPKSFDLLKRST